MSLRAASSLGKSRLERLEASSTRTLVAPVGVLPRTVIVNSSAEFATAPYLITRFEVLRLRLPPSLAFAFAFAAGAKATHYDGERDHACGSDEVETRPCSGHLRDSLG